MENVFQEQMPELHSLGRVFQVMMGTPMLGTVQWTRGAIDEARSTFERALNLSAGRSTASECETHARLAILEAEAGNTVAATQHVARSEESLNKGNGWRGGIGLINRARAATASASDRLDEAEPLFSDAIEIFRHYDLPFDEAETLRTWGRALTDHAPQRGAAVEIFTSHDVGKAWIDRVRADRQLIT